MYGIPPSVPPEAGARRRCLESSGSRDFTRARDAAAAAYSSSPAHVWVPIFFVCVSDNSATGTAHLPPTLKTGRFGVVLGEASSSAGFSFFVLFFCLFVAPGGLFTSSRWRREALDTPRRAKVSSRLVIAPALLCHPAAASPGSWMFSRCFVIALCSPSLAGCFPALVALGLGCADSRDLR